ncbi:hypothetical protein [uncultured Subdoligranulum sp.]|uniref:hypothetical protein n=1 Tax=uncultured Subdoligranulum sp. TaxID=512298 RepID=UPI002607A1A2|nr:hypothetical protein [uncultured Subdoligranulum sp.]
MSVPAVWVIGIFWIGYGILGILGIQNIPERYKYRSWTPDYMRANGIGMVILGVSWVILGIVLKLRPMPVLPGFGLAVVFSLPALGYAFYADRKTREERRQADKEWRETKKK